LLERSFRIRRMAVRQAVSVIRPAGGRYRIPLVFAIVIPIDVLAPFLIPFLPRRDGPAPVLSLFTFILIACVLLRGGGFRFNGRLYTLQSV
jgi:hypothetical protein